MITLRGHPHFFERHQNKDWRIKKMPYLCMQRTNYGERQNKPMLSHWDTDLFKNYQRRLHVY